jgi:pSer/pThr/pTyr-binding forkhead associated (FHA) protein
MRAALVFHRPGGEHRFELTGSAVTIGRGADCELRLPDDRISTRHCRISAHGGDWMIEDLKSTNRTFVNGEPLGDPPRRLRHGDMVRLGARDTQLFEARFVLDERADEYRAAARAVAEGLHCELAELRAQLAARGDEVARLGALVKRLQGQLAEGEAAAASARRAGATMTAENEELRGQLAIERTEHAACRDEVERVRRRCAELEADVAAQARRSRRDLAEGERARADLESRLRLTSSELAATRAALTTATDNVRTLQQAHDDALVQLQGLEPRTPAGDRR